MKIKDKDFNKTLELLNTAIQLLPKNDDIITYAYDLRGQCQFELDNFNLAIEDWEKAVEINKEPAYSLNNLGNIYVLLNNLPKAITFYESSLSM
ncbi:MAG TPA: tetratricopeptide repeat protein, partial [Ignavibacteria bacterium]|nr:tetratricopeptide repeat protein [Ignavibacteria bacterium]